MFTIIFQFVSRYDNFLTKVTIVFDIFFSHKSLKSLVGFLSIISAYFWGYFFTSNYFYTENFVFKEPFLV